MLTAEIIQKLRKNEKIDRLVLRDTTGMFIMGYDDVCKEVKEGNLTIIGYSLVDNNGRLSLKEDKCKETSTNDETELLVDKDLLSGLEQNTHLVFKTVNNLSEELLKFDGAVYRLSQHCFLENSGDTLNLVSDKRFKIKDGYELFQDKQFKTVDLTSVDMADVESTERMFEGCNIQNVIITFGNTSKLKNMKAMFMNSNINTLSLRSIQTKNVSDMSYMFCNSNIGKLKTYRSAFNTYNVVDMTKMFFGCNSELVKGAKVENFDICHLLSADYMFSRCNVESLNLSNWKITDILSMRGCFSGATIGTLVMNRENLPDSEEMFINSTIGKM